MIKLPQKRLRKIILLAFFCLSIILLEGCYEKEQVYEPGVYISQAEGYYSTLIVEVSMTAYGIDSIKILEHEEPQVLSETVFEKLPPRIIKAGTTDIDVISGATYTSEALLKAVEQALTLAKGAKE